MLLKFTTADMLSTALIDVATGERAYGIETVLQPAPDPALVVLPSTSSSQPCSSFASSSYLPEKPPRLSPPPDAEHHKTTITDASGHVHAQILWTGRQPDITIHDEHVGGLTDLFGSSTIRFMYVLSLFTKTSLTISQA